MNPEINKPQREAALAVPNEPPLAGAITLTAAGDGELPDRLDNPPTDLFIEATDASGELAVWFDDFWWMEVLSRWANNAMVVHFLPSRHAMLNPVVLHQVNMIARVAPLWRPAGYAYSAEINGDDDITTMACSAYAELRLQEGARPGSGQARLKAHSMRIEDIVGRVSRIQKQRGTTRPILILAKSIPAAPGDAELRRVTEMRIPPTRNETPAPRRAPATVEQTATKPIAQ